MLEREREWGGREGVRVEWREGRKRKDEIIDPQFVDLSSHSKFQWQNQGSGLGG